ncbi:MAG: hypothetical protein ACI8QG_000513, partial [Flavobacteriales bacterium]
NTLNKETQGIEALLLPTKRKVINSHTLVSYCRYSNQFK